MSNKNICQNCGHDNPVDNFICENIDCGIPMDITININDIGLPDIEF